MYTFLHNFSTFPSPRPSFLLILFRLLRDASAPRLNVCFLQGDTIARSFFVSFQQFYAGSAFSPLAAYLPPLTASVIVGYYPTPSS